MAEELTGNATVQVSVGSGISGAVRSTNDPAKGQRMISATDPHRTDDPYNLSRFVLAQNREYAPILLEIKSGKKRTHWMWYIFPQLDGLGFNATAKHYAIKSLAEAQAYLAHSLLGPRLRECMEAVLQLEGRSARDIFGTSDDLKLRSCATLFACVSPPDSVFDRVLRKYYPGGRDGRTLQLLGTAPRTGADTAAPSLTDACAQRNAPACPPAPCPRSRRMSLPTPSSLAPKTPTILRPFGVMASARRGRQHR